MIPQRKLHRLLPLLREAYGPRPWRSWGKGLDVLVDTILSQNTSAANSNAAYRQLRRAFPSWTKVMQASMEGVERAIRVAGLSRIKAPRIQEILRQVKAEHGRLELEFLREGSAEDAFEYLTRFRGVGPKTAACILLFSFGMPLFPVDTHIHRIARRLGLVGARATATQTQDQLTPLIPAEDRYEMHVLLIEHGRRTCRAVSPACARCPIRALCPFGKQRLAAQRISTTPIS